MKKIFSNALIFFAKKEKNGIFASKITPNKHE
jgi:hypothetical protein